MKENPYNDMDETASRVAYLIAGFIRHTLTKKEHDELDTWVDESDHNMQLFEDLTDERNLIANLEMLDKNNAFESYKQMQQKGAFNKPQKNIFKRRIWVAAASVIIMISIFFIYRYTISNRASVDDIVTTDTGMLRPGGNRATLVLADGKVIDLNYAKTGALQDGSGSIVHKTADGELVYAKDSAVSHAAAFHTLSTPVGGQYHVTLPDGTKVWLNAATTIKYSPTTANKERIVKLTGEAYFEVAKNEQRPFKVLLEDNTTVLVTGTHFNIQAYKNINRGEVTLLEGSVNVSNAFNTTKLEPGTQAVLKDREIIKRKVSDIKGITGWKDGLFVFHDAPIESIMMQIERWYGAKIIYKAKTKQLFNATILRKEPLVKILKLLELNGYVHFKIENKIIYVLP